MRMDFKAPARVLACRKQKYKKNSVAHLSVNAYFAAGNSGQQWTASIAQMEAEKRRGEKTLMPIVTTERTFCKSGLFHINTKESRGNNGLFAKLFVTLAFRKTNLFSIITKL